MVLVETHEHAYSVQSHVALVWYSGSSKTTGVLHKTTSFCAPEESGFHDSRQYNPGTAACGAGVSVGGFLDDGFRARRAGTRSEGRGITAERDEYIAVGYRGAANGNLRRLVIC